MKEITTDKAEIEEAIRKGTIFIDSFSKEIYEQTYRFEDEDINGTHKRVADNLASIEIDKEYWADKFLYALEDFKFVPGGRILSNAGTGLKGTTYINCFLPETLVLTDRGYKKIVDIKVSDVVLTHKGRWRKVVSVMSKQHSGLIDKYSSSLLTGDIKVTKEHPFYQGGNKFIKSEENNKLVLLSSVESNEKKLDISSFIDITNIYEDEDYISTLTETISGNNAIQTRSSAKIKRKLALNSKLSYVLGRFVGDGSTWKQNKESAYYTDSFNIAFSKDEGESLERIKSIIENSFGIEMNINENSNGSLYLRKSNPILSLFLSSSCGRGFANKKIPDFIWSSTPEIKKSFLIGLIDADGTVTKKGYIKIGLNNEKLIDDIQAMLNMINIPSRKTPMMRKGVNEGYLLYINKEYSSGILSELNKVYSDDRITKTEVVNNGIKAIIDESTDSEKIHSIVDFKKTEEYYEGRVYNISVEEDESYVVNNVAVHNCFVDGFTGEDKDSMEGILDTLKRQALILKSEGGYGFCADTMRPRGAYIRGIGNESPGAVEMLSMWDTQSAVITAGSGRKSKRGKQKIRKGAQMVTMSVWHPDIEEFITSKQTPGRLTKFNMSLLVSDSFMEAVKNNSKWNLEFPAYEVHSEEYKKIWDGNLNAWKEAGLSTIIYKTYENANELWDLIMKSTYNRNEPGILFADTINEKNNLHYCEYISATNPCLVGDSLVMTDKGDLKLEDLVSRFNSGEEFKIKSYNETSGDVEYKNMLWGDLTRKEANVIRLNLEDGNKLELTPDHKVFTKNRGWIEASQLLKSDILLSVK